MVAKLALVLAFLAIILVFVSFVVLPRFFGYLESRRETGAELRREEMEQVDELVEEAESEYWEREEP